MTIFLRKISFYFAVGGIVALTMLVKSLSQTPAMPAPPIKPVTKPAAHAIAASGLVEARNENTNIGVPMPGLVTSVNVKVWQQVKKNDVLMQLDDRELRAQLLTQVAQIQVATASLKRLEDQLSRLQSASSSGAVTLDEISTRKNDVEVSRAQLASAEATREQTKLLMERLTIRAPIDGTILQINTRVGEYASGSGKSAAMVLGQIDLLQVRADVDEQLAPRVSENMTAQAWIKGDSTHPMDLAFVRIEPFIVPKISLTGSSAERVDTRVLQVIFTLKPDQQRKVYVGQQMDIYLMDPASPPSAPAN
jgi:HlyD family secretion protein